MKLLKLPSWLAERPPNSLFYRLVNSLLLSLTVLPTMAVQNSTIDLNQLIDAADTITEIKVVSEQAGDCSGYQVEITKAYLPIKPRRILLQSPIKLKPGQVYYVFLLEPGSDAFATFYSKSQAAEMAKCAGQHQLYTIVSPHGVMPLSAEKKLVAVDKQIQLPVFLKPSSDKDKFWLEQGKWDEALVELVEGC